MINQRIIIKLWAFLLIMQGLYSSQQEQQPVPAAAQAAIARQLGQRLLALQQQLQAEQQRNQERQQQLFQENMQLQRLIGNAEQQQLNGNPEHQNFDAQLTAERQAYAERLRNATQLFQQAKDDVQQNTDDFMTLIHMLTAAKAFHASLKAKSIRELMLPLLGNLLLTITTATLLYRKQGAIQQHALIAVAGQVGASVAGIISHKAWRRVQQWQQQRQKKLLAYRRTRHASK
ncbi:hypothetical protein M1466_02115 [Candidatus Dependentiae bacterium]|nr:hypothetical protein [Candidatus Dependentiae bacterium]